MPEIAIAQAATDASKTLRMIHLEARLPPTVADQQHSHWKSSDTASARFIQYGGRSSSVTSATGLNTLKWCRVSSDQNAITVSIGGQPGTAQDTSATRIAPSPSENRARTHSRTRLRAAECSGACLANARMITSSSCPALCRASTSY